ncbi:conserved hypothetical protein [Halobaculum gomorrense]|uniref:CSD domain-containing protein n=7 Tax=Halobaculum TaxID=43927 RepID=A0A1M5KHN5_9EURY|nr:conserved hypothetical protein [Halobaculum gomorrense]
MTKIAITLQRREGTSAEAFREYYREEHAPLAAELSGLERYTVSFPADSDSASYDALAELHFPDGEAIAAAFDSELGREVTADAEAFADMDAAGRVVLDEEVVVGRARRRTGVLIDILLFTGRSGAILPPRVDSSHARRRLGRVISGPPFISCMATGKVDFFNDTGGYGFIETEDADEDVFFHMEDVGGPDLEEGQEVEFDIEEAEKGPRAKNLQRL